MNTRKLYFRTYHDDGDYVIGFYADSDASAIESARSVYLPKGERMSLHRGIDYRVASFVGSADSVPVIRKGTR